MEVGAGDVCWSPEAGQSVGDVSSMAGMFSADCSPLCAAVGYKLNLSAWDNFNLNIPLLDGEVMAS